ncbi:DUF4266 domain-containing protein [Haloferula sargassicola]|uniref:DUF4266 domain-containing protein n=1 Tax=Haloferula sargassicola TaxID=490096 RepID=A0ABP9UT82_9BACT
MSTLRLLLLLVPFFATACARVQPWERDNLAREVMSPGRDPLGSAMSEHIYFSREAAHGGKGVGGGGCGCN